MIDETTLYYYFSTVSQTIGALLGVVGAFTVFKIQRLEQDVLNLVDIFCKNLSFARTMPNAIVSRDLFNAINNDIKKGNIKEIVIKTKDFLGKTKEEEILDLKKEFRDVQNKYNYKINITERLLTVTVAGMILIFISLSLLLLVKSLSRETYYLYIIIILSWGILVLTLFLFYKLIEKLIKE